MKVQKAKFLKSFGSVYNSESISSISEQQLWLLSDLREYEIINKETSDYLFNEIDKGNLSDISGF